MPPIVGQSILAIGGTSGIGFAVAQLAVSQRVHVSMGSSSADRVAAAFTGLKLALGRGPYIKGFTIDLSRSTCRARTSKRVSRPCSRTRPPGYILEQAQLGLVVSAALIKLAPQFLELSYKSSLMFCGGRVAEKPVKGWSAAVFRGWT
ncbi:hypothetical protein F4819DRAFT_486115 [Hypoxylon fuscum]|nr:hypothetical protein F4819DRAFT_486115 [Hypoxylon fuscum]